MTNTTTYTSLTDEVESLRNELRNEPQCHFVPLPDFCKLLISLSHLERWNEMRARLAGLRDISTGVRYFIEFEKLGVDP